MFRSVSRRLVVEPYSAALVEWLWGGTLSLFLAVYTCGEGLQFQRPALCVSLNYWGHRMLLVPDHLGRATFSLACHSTNFTTVHPTCTTTYKVSSVPQVMLFFLSKTRVCHFWIFPWLEQTQINRCVGEARQGRPCKHTCCWDRVTVNWLNFSTSFRDDRTQLCYLSYGMWETQNVCAWHKGDVSGILWRWRWCIEKKELGCRHQEPQPDGWVWRKRSGATKGFFVTITCYTFLGKKQEV